MTTIAFKDGILAADSRSTSGTMVSGSVKKIIGGDGFYTAITGDTQDKNPVFKYLKDGGEKPKIANLNGIVVKNGKMQLFDDKLEPYDMGCAFYALGSGRELAIGAMAAGATAEEAVKIACEYDVHTGGPVHVVNTNTEVKK